MNRTFNYTITKTESDLNIYTYLLHKGYSRQNITELKKYPESILVNGKWEYVDTINETIEYKFNIASSSSNVEFLTYDLRKLYKTPLLTGQYRFIQETDIGKVVSNSFEIIDNINTTETEQ